jgi:hypothetical protein
LFRFTKIVETGFHTKGGGDGGNDINIVCSFFDEEMSVENLEFPIKNAFS